MAQERYTRTNQKLFFAGLALTALGDAEQSRAMDAQGRIQAEREAAIFHLYGGLLGLCHEIAGFYRLPQAAAPRAELLLNDAVLQQIAIPEMAEMLELAKQPDTWLAQLLNAHAALYLPPVQPVVVKGDVTQPLIQAVNLDAPVADILSRDMLEQWRQSLKDLIRRFRDALSEC